MDLIKIKDPYRKEYIIEETGIAVKHYRNKKLPSIESYPYENVKRDTFFFADRSPAYLIFAGLSLIMCITALAEDSQPASNIRYISAGIFFFITFGGVMMYFLYYPKIYFLKTFNGKFIRFRVKNNEEELSAFIQAALKKRDEYIIMKYGNPSPYLSYDGQFSNFQIMLKEQMISQEMYLQKVKTLNSLFEQQQPQQVFATYSQN